MIVKVLGPGCTNCAALEKRTRQALAGLGLEATVEKVTDYGQIAGYGVMSTPGLIVDEQLLVQGRVPTVAALSDLLAEAAGR
jgi:small redox-active disulfide protein 2